MTMPKKFKVSLEKTKTMSPWNSLWMLRATVWEIYAWKSMENTSLYKMEIIWEMYKIKFKMPPVSLTGSLCTIVSIVLKNWWECSSNVPRLMESHSPSLSASKSKAVEPTTLLTLYNEASQMVAKLWWQFWITKPAGSTMTLNGYNF